MNEGAKLRGKYVDMIKHWSWDNDNDIWILCQHDTKIPILVGNRSQILKEFDAIESTGIIKTYD